MKLAWVALLLALGSCNRAPETPCQTGHAVDKHPYEVRGALMIFIRGNATLVDAAHHRVYGIAEFSEQPQRLLTKVYEKAKANKLDEFKSTVSVGGYAYTCSLCGEHKVIVTSMAASDPTEFTDEDFRADQKQANSWFAGAPALPPKCEPPMS